MNNKNHLDDSWKILKFSDCIKQLNTGLNPRNNFSLGKGNIKYITAKNLTSTGLIDFEKCDFIDEKAKTIINKRSDIKKGDILFSSRAPIGQCHLIKEDPNYFDIGESIFSIRVNQEIVLPEYFCLYLSSDYFIKSASQNTTGSVIQEIRVSNLMETKVIIPPKNIQIQIAQSLNSIDCKMQINHKINTELEAMAKTLYDYWFLQFEFPNEEGKPYKSSGGKMVWNEELKREIPEGWKVMDINSVISESSKSAVQVNEANMDGNYPFFTSGNAILRYSEYFTDGFNCYLNTGGNPGIKGYLGKAAYSTDTWCISSEEYGYWLYFYITNIMPVFEQLFFAGSGLKHLQKDIFKRQKVVLPCKETIDTFNSIVKNAFCKITICINENQELTSLRDFLLPLLMNGQVGFKKDEK